MCLDWQTVIEQLYDWPSLRSQRFMPGDINSPGAALLPGNTAYQILVKIDEDYLYVSLYPSLKKLCT